MAFNSIFVVIVGAVLSIAYKISARPKDKYLALFPQAVEPNGIIATMKDRLNTTLGNVISTIDIGYEKVGYISPQEILVDTCY